MGRQSKQYVKVPVDVHVGVVVAVALDFNDEPPTKEELRIVAEEAALERILDRDLSSTSQMTARAKAGKIRDAFSSGPGSADVVASIYRARR